MDRQGPVAGATSNQGQESTERPSKKASKPRQRHHGYEADYGRALVCQLAYDLDVEPIGTKIEAAINQQIARQAIPEPFQECKAPDIAALDEYSRRLAEFIAACPKPSRWNRFYGVLSAKTLLSEETDQFVNLGIDVVYLKQHVFWPVYRHKRLDLAAYRQYIKRFARFTDGVIPGCSGWEIPNPMPRPPNALLDWIEKNDSLGSVTAAMLTFGVARDCGWSDLQKWSFERVLHSLCRVASTAPFETFADELIPNVVTAMLAGDPPDIATWQQYVKDVLREYPGILKLARDTGILEIFEGRPTSLIEHDLALLRYADDFKRDRLRRQINSYAQDRNKPNSCIAELVRRIDAAEELSYF